MFFRIGIFLLLLIGLSLLLEEPPSSEPAKSIIRGVGMGLLATAVVEILGHLDKKFKELEAMLRKKK